MQTSHGKTERTETKQIMAITGMWTIFDHAKRQSEYANTNRRSEKEKRTGIQAVAELH